MPHTSEITTLAAGTAPETAADLASAFAAGAELLLVITGDGREQVYLRGRDRMALVRDEMASYEVGSPMLDETVALAMQSAEEAQRYREDPPELVLRQAEPRFMDRLADAAHELDLDTDLPASDLIARVLEKAENDLSGLQLAAAAFYGQAHIHHSYTMDFHDLLNGASPYWKTAEATGVDPALLAQLVLWETPHFVSFWERADYGLMYSLGMKSFGIAQIKVATATEMLDRYLDRFADLGSVISGMRDETQSWDEYEVGWALFSNEEFSIRVAGAYLSDIGSRLEANMAKAYHVKITEAHIEDPRSITRHELQMLAAIGYNQGEDKAKARLKDRYTEGAVSVIRDTIRPGNVPDAMPPASLQAELEASLERLGVKVSDRDSGELHIRSSELELLTRVAFDQGLDQLLAHLGAECKRVGAARVVAGVKNTLRLNDYDDNVLSKRDAAYALYGISYKADQHAS